jgi:hypothetical protein
MPRLVIIVILSEVIASLREAITQSKDLYSSRTSFRGSPSDTPSLPSYVDE